MIMPSRLLLTACIALLVTAPVRAADSTAGERREFRDLAYVSDGHARQKLDLFLPEAPAPRPLIVWIHGGGWQGGSKDRAPAQELVARGYAVASINYRLSQHGVFPAQIEDCKTAIRWLRAHAGEYGLDSARVGVWGASAGGHLASLLGATGNTREFDKGEHLDQPSSVQCVINWFGPTDFLNYGNPPWAGLDATHGMVARLLGGRVSENRDAARRASPIYFVSRESAPFLIMQGDTDNLVPAQQSEILHAALQKAGVESTLKIYRGAGHGGRVFTSPEARQLMIGFFDRHLRATVAAR